MYSDTPVLSGPSMIRGSGFIKSFYILFAVLGMAYSCLSQAQEEVGSITIVKQTNVDGVFDFAGFGPGGGFFPAIQTVNGTGQVTIANRPAGDFSIAELDPSPFVLISASCDNDDDPSDITLDPGEDLVCTFVNSRQIAVPVNNEWVLLLLALMLLVTGCYFSSSAKRRF